MKCKKWNWGSEKIFIKRLSARDKEMDRGKVQPKSRAVFAVKGCTPVGKKSPSLHFLWQIHYEYNRRVCSIHLVMLEPKHFTKWMSTPISRVRLKVVILYIQYIPLHFCTGLSTLLHTLLQSTWERTDSSLRFTVPIHCATSSRYESIKQTKNTLIMTGKSGRSTPEKSVRKEKSAKSGTETQKRFSLQDCQQNNNNKKKRVGKRIKCKTWNWDSEKIFIEKLSKKTQPTNKQQQQKRKGRKKNKMQKSQTETRKKIFH